MIVARNFHKQENYRIEQYAPASNHVQVTVIDRHTDDETAKVLITETMIVEYIEDLLKEL